MRVRVIETALIMILAAATGCAEKFTHKNFNLVQVGVDERYDVNKLLGHPTNEVDEAWYYEHPKKDYSAMIHFARDGKVSGKQWFDSPTGDIIGDDPKAGRKSRSSNRKENSGHATMD